MFKLTRSKLYSPTYGYQSNFIYLREFIEFLLSKMRGYASCFLKDHYHGVSHSEKEMLIPRIFKLQNVHLQKRAQENSYNSIEVACVAGGFVGV